MSDQHEAPVVQEDDRVPGGAISRVLVISIVVTIASIGVSTLLLHGWSNAPDRGLPAPSVAPSTIDAIHQTALGEEPAEGLTLRQTQRASLEGYSWVDRDAGVARIPIERAMRIVVDSAASTAPSGSAP